MPIRRKFKSDAFEAIHSSAAALYKAGAIDKATMRNFDASCLAVPAPLKPTDQEAARKLACQPASLCAVPQYERVHD